MNAAEIRMLLKNAAGGATSIYQRVSIEHDIPLDVAKAMLIIAVGILPEVRAAITAHDEGRSSRLAAAMVGPFLALADKLQLPPTRLERAMEMTCEEYLKNLGAAVERIARERAKPTIQGNP